MIRLPEGASNIEQLAALPAEERIRRLTGIDGKTLQTMLREWRLWARDGQKAPEGDWRTWLILAGRGFGKTRAGSEWVKGLAGAWPGARIALVAATNAEARAVMVEGPSGLLSVCDENFYPKWESSLGRLIFPSGAQALLYSASEPDALRGPQHHFAWCDEFAKWAYPQAAWDNLVLGLRLGSQPRALVTTTPKPLPILKRLMKDGGTRVTRGRTADNLLLAQSYVDAVTENYGGTRLGRQELEGELIEDVEGALWPRGLIERRRTAGPRARLVRVVIGVDPPASSGGDACGIVAAGLGEDGCGYVLTDHSVEGKSPEGWARAVAEAAECHAADRVIAEANNGGEMVESVLRAVRAHLPVTLVHASRGKTARAEPVAALFEKERAWFAGAFPELEDELAGLVMNGGYEGPGKSPDRADAMVWAMTELMLGRERSAPRVRRI